MTDTPNIVLTGADRHATIQDDAHSLPADLRSAINVDRPGPDADAETWDAWEATVERVATIDERLQDAHLDRWEALLRNAGYRPERYDPSEIDEAYRSGRLRRDEVIEFGPEGIWDADADPAVARAWQQAWDETDEVAIVRAVTT